MPNIGIIMLMKLDSADRRILRELQSNGRLSNVELAERVGLSDSPCLRRVRRLEKNSVIKGYNAVIDHHKIGLDIVAYIQVNLDQRSEANTAAFQDAVANEPLIIECYALTGDYDFLLKAAAADLDEFADLTLKRILRYPGVDSITSSLILEVLREQRGFPV